MVAGAAPSALAMARLETSGCNCLTLGELLALFDHDFELIKWKAAHEGVHVIEAASGASVDQVDSLVGADIDIGRVCRLTVGVFPAQIHVTILALRYFSPRPLAGFQRA
jgi:hypothetical protein